VVDRSLAVLRSDALVDLAGDQALEGLGLQAHRFRTEVGQDLRGSGEQEVAGEDRDRVVPARIRRGYAAAQRGLIHHIVVVERGQVREFDDGPRRHDAGRVAVAELGGEEGEQRTEPLAARVDQVARGLGDERMIAARGRPQQFLDRAEPVANALFERRVGHREPERLGRHLHAHDCRLPFIATAHVGSTLMHVTHYRCTGPGRCT